MDAKQNGAIEKAARDAAAGKRFDWRRTPFEITSAARASDPARIQDSGGPSPGCGWWSHAEPDFLRSQGERIARSVGLDLAYCAEPISETIAQTPDGFWIVRNATIGRTGFQTYKVREIADPEGLLDSYGPDEEIELWRDPSEVFSTPTIASFEGKSLTLGHPRELLNPDTDTDHAVGHVQNIRRGREPLDSGHLPLVGDLVVKDREAIEAIKSGERELSCGYTYRLAKEGNRFDQREIRGNHIAIVPTGRAGSEVRVETGAVRDGKKEEQRQFE